ncbi:four-carbon acid sugar kinase family protein [Propionivibrio dicarboxylicus]|uniref:Uncharacterized conserved protein YgbK, DUF1537 family n=1 Tax=Propionivibrio dicarboxylicus TaxID=83767 RepID=A0A1G7Z1S1_9RHOO|nr:four-carbon acid sugar kinase family protein [Propionivibrio dicarboxylicus]SDH02594.1 Uncharacterized conserved protein YgbK, DUF1537 family [Propionivibrio dicarboxylicus]
MRKKVGVIADNLTGANDSGVQFKKYGLNTRVILPSIPENISEHIADTDIVVVSTETRRMSPEESYARVYEIAKQLLNLKFDHYYKKVDSTLRGRVAEEIEAAMDALAMSVAVVVPSFPESGRLVRNGYLEILQDIDEGVSYPVCYVPSVIQGKSNSPVAILTLDDVHNGPLALGKCIKQLARGGIKKIVIDAVSDKDLYIIALSLASLRIPYLAVGSAGLASHLPIAWNLVQGTSAANRRVVVLVGTSNKVSADQVKNLCRSSQTVLVPLDTHGIYNGDCTKITDEAVETAGRILAGEKIPVIVLDSLMAGWSDAIGITERITNFSSTVSDIFANISKALIDKFGANTLFIVGGGTATDVCHRLAVSAIDIDRELEPGIPLGALIGGPYEGLRIITKGGGIGHADTLTEVLNHVSPP